MTKDDKRFIKQYYKSDLDIVLSMGGKLIILEAVNRKVRNLRMESNLIYDENLTYEQTIKKLKELEIKYNTKLEVI